MVDVETPAESRGCCHRAWPAARDQKAVDDAIGKVLNEINGAYMEKVQTPSQKAQEAFDDITDHGRNKVKEDRVAIANPGTDAFSSRPDDPGAAKVDATKFDEAIKSIDEFTK